MSVAKLSSESVKEISEGRVRYEVIDKVGVITIDDYERRNALSQPVREGLFEAFRTLDADDNAKVGMLTGTETTFCAGAYLGELTTTVSRLPPRDYMPMIGHNVFIDKVLLAGVNGHALGGGFSLMLSADLVVASENATFGLPEVKWSRGAPWSVPLFGKIPERVWMEIALTGEPIDAQRAYEIGLINRVVPLEQLFDSTLEFATKIANAAPLTVRATRRTIHLAAEMGRSAAWETANELFRSVFTSEDGQEGPRSFMEKRPAVWTGK